MSVAVPPETEIVITGLGQRRTVVLDPAGVTLGRAEPCGIVLADRQVSRPHARLYKDPFGRWIVEDLGSRNGTWVGGERVTLRAVSPGERMVIGPFTLTLSGPQDQRIPASPSALTTTSLLEDGAEEGLVQVPPDARETLSGRRLKDLNALGDSLARVTDSRDLYSEACRCLATVPGSVALVLRLVAPAEGSVQLPETLACHFAPASATAGAEPQGGAAPPSNFRLSRRVVQSVAASGLAVTASSVRLTGDQLGLTVIDDLAPRAVYCAPITRGDGWIDALYVEAPADKGAPDVLDFVRAAARQIGFAGQGILRAEDAVWRRLLDHQLAMAHEIQRGLIPERLDLAPGIDLALAYEPAFWVGGDYCDVWCLPDGRIAFAVGDVSGKGLPAALVMANLHAALRTALAFQPEPSEAMRHISRHLHEHMPAGTFVTMVLGLLDAGTGRLEVLNAGHILPLVVGPSATVSPLGEPRNLPLGLVDADFVQEAVTLDRGAALVLVTDGVTEARSPGGEEFGSQRLMDVLHGRPFAGSQDLVHAVTQAVSAFRGPLPPHDDLTVLALLRGGSGAGESQAGAGG